MHPVFKTPGAKILYNIPIHKLKLQLKFYCTVSKCFVPLLFLSLFDIGTLVGSNDTRVYYEYVPYNFRKSEGVSRSNVNFSVEHEYEFHSAFTPLSTKKTIETPTLLNVTVNLCHSWGTGDRDAGQKMEFVYLPFLSSTTRSYSLKQFRVNQTSSSCNGSPLIPISEVDLQAKLDELDDVKFFFFLRNSTFLLPNGYLSVGHLGKLAKYFAPGEYCIDLKSKDALLGYRTCLRNETLRPVLRKCCPFEMILDGMGGCVEIEDGQTPIGFQFLDTGEMEVKSEEVANPLFLYQVMECSPGSREVWVEDECTIKFHPTLDNRVAYIGAHRSWEYLKESNYCIDGQVNGSNVMWWCAGNETVRGTVKQARISLIYMLSMYVGSIFHGITTTVYGVTWRKQNIHGKTLCSCTGSLFFMQVFLGTAHLLGKLGNVRLTWFCVANGICAHFFMIAAFTWLVVVNADLWRTFKAIRPDSSKSSTKFLKYSLFGWGIPTFVTLVSVCMEAIYRCRVSGVVVPEYGDNICFVAPWAQGYYVYYIISVLIALSLLFSSLTFVGLFRYKKDSGELRSTKTAHDKQNAFLFLKLSVLMGLTWVFEVVSWASTDEGDVGHVVWIILDLYNALSSILIFVVFVCKRSILELLKRQVLPNTGTRKSDSTTTHL